MKIVLLDNSMEEKYDNFLLDISESLFYHSNKYRHFLRSYLKSKDIYFLAIDNDEIIGALPSFLFEGEKGKVLNSLPFYGSNGGVISKVENRDVVSEILVDEFLSFGKNNGCVASTIITSPFGGPNAFYEQLEYDFRDERIGQITSISLDENSEEKLMKKFSSRATDVRKALKNSINVIERNDEKGIQFIMETHHENMDTIGGLSKPSEFFDLIPAIFTPGEDYKIYIAEKNGEFIAGVLLFYYNQKVEYFTPVVKAEYRTYQPLSLLIFRAFEDAAKRGFTSWNWGGTWISQEGVFNFKKKWNTDNTSYYYYSFLYAKEILQLSREEILSAFPNFFVLPFNVLKK